MIRCVQARFGSGVEYLEIFFVNFEIISKHNSTVLNSEHVFLVYYVIRKLNVTELSYLLLNVIFQNQFIIQTKKCLIYIINIFVVYLLVWKINCTQIQGSYIKTIKIFQNR
jgi:hypothetical protein